MRKGTSGASPPFALPATVILLALGVVMAGNVSLAGVVGDNINPNNDGSKYAWSENLGWLNAQPGGPGGYGVYVSDSALTGFMWSENAGWVNMSGASFGVRNNGCGALSGFAWSENAGWINFAPANCAGDPTCGVKIDPRTGIFSGRAWSENAGWITFSGSIGFSETIPATYRVMTSWHRTPPSGASGLLASKSGAADVSFSWAAVLGATAYDVVRGGLNALRSSNGNFQTATQACVANDTAGTSYTTTGGATPAVGDGFWFLVRGSNCGGAGTYNSGAVSQVGSRDAGINASGNSCP